MLCRHLLQYWGLYYMALYLLPWIKKQTKKKGCYDKQNLWLIQCSTLLLIPPTIKEGIKVVLLSLKTLRIPNKPQTCICIHDLSMAKFAAALMLEDVSLSFPCAHHLSNRPVLLLTLLIVSFRRLSVPSEHQRLKQTPSHYYLLTRQVGVPDMWLVWVTL